MIDATGLQKVYRTEGAETRALDGVDLRVEAGEFVAVMGPSGSGKSTLLHMLGGLDTPDDGRVLVGGRDLGVLSRDELAEFRRREVGVVFQAFNLVPVLTVEENILLPASLDRRRRRHERVVELLSRFGLGPHRNKLPSQLSGGEQQRTAIARALVNEPAVLLADEPTGNLDRTSGAALMDLLAQLHTDGQTIIVVTHDPVVAARARRVVFMRDGRLVDELELSSAKASELLVARLVELET